MINAILGTITIIVIASVCWCLVLTMRIVEYFINDEDNNDMGDWP